MSNIYKYSIVDDLGGKYDQIVLYDTISAAIHTDKYDPFCTGLENVDNESNVEVHFTTQLSGSKETILNGIISDYEYVSPFKKRNYYPFQLRYTSTDSTNYYIMGTTTYPGCDNLSDIFEIEFQSYMEPGTTSYDVQFIDKNTNKIVAEGNFTNTTLQRNTLTNIVHCPTDLSTIEIAVKINKTGMQEKYVYVTEAIFWLASR